MDYEKLHKDTINKLQQMVNSGKITVEIARGICADFVPESDDEKIRKAIYNCVKRFGFDSCFFKDVSQEECLAWLEKQGEHNPAETEKGTKGNEREIPNSAWSDGDIVAIDCAVDVLSKDLPSLAASIERLKSLRPQNTWKPSDEQMLALKHASNDCSIAFADMKILATLYEQLKALHRYEQDT